MTITLINVEPTRVRSTVPLRDEQLVEVEERPGKTITLCIDALVHDYEDTKGHRFYIYSVIKSGGEYDGWGYEGSEENPFSRI